MGKKVTIIGAGNVGATIGFTLAVKGLASEILFVDVAKEKALGEAMDIYQATPVCEPVYVHAGDYPDAANSDIVVITSGIARRPGQTRLELAQTNVNILKSITEQITKYAPNAIYIIVSNPVDILTYVFTKISGIPEEPHHRLRHAAGFRAPVRHAGREAGRQPEGRSRLRAGRTRRYLVRAVVHGDRGRREDRRLLQGRVRRPKV